MAASDFRVQYMSDLHLELFPGFRIAPEDVAASVLLLAGDIGDPGSDEYRAFMLDCALKFEAVYVVLGNHEGYGRSWDEALRLASSACLNASASAQASSSVTLLDRGSATVPPRLTGGRRIRVLGATLWSRVSPSDAYEVGCFIADYRRIEGVRSVADTNAMHAADVAWLRAELSLLEAAAEGENACDGIIVLTHHAPSMRGTSRKEHEGGPLNGAFATALDDLVDRPGVLAWVHGHTHHSHETRRPANGAVLCANQRGYAYEGAAAGFDARRTVAVAGTNGLPLRSKEAH